jgi:hypothetical protein
MDPNVPAGAAMLLDFIAGLETNRPGEAGYETIIGYRNEKPGTLPKPITQMTLEELLAEQRRWVKNLKAPSGAAGRYQIIRPTLLSLIAELGVPLSATFTPELQDRFGLALLKRRGWNQFAASTLSLRDFGNRLAREWASVPVLSRQQGAHRTVERGESYYAGDGINASLARASEAEAVLAEVLNALNGPTPSPEPTPAPQPPTPKPGKDWDWLGWALITGFALLIAFVTTAFTVRF